MQESKIGPCTLVGTWVRLQPLEEKHCEALLEACRSFVWAWLPRDLSTIDGMREWVREALEAEKSGTAYPLVVSFKDDGRVIGSTHYLEVVQEYRTVEIGWTWYSPGNLGHSREP